MGPGENIMKRILLATVVLTAFATANAIAADIPARMPAKAPGYVTSYNWTGLYLGINGGGTWGRSNWTGGGISTGNFDASGALIGGTIGSNWQTGAMVLGLEGDLDWSSIRGSTAITCVPNCETRNSWLGTVRGRLGFAWDRVMPFVTGGVAFGNIRAGGVGLATETSTKAGWTVGAGLEAAIAGPWTAKVEYLYVDLGNSTCSAVTCGVATNVRFNANILRGGINYRF
jgi:outer membrane immunogenic protein